MSQEVIYHSTGDLNKIYKKYHNNILKLMSIYNSLDKQLVLPMEPIISDINDSVYFKTKIKNLSSEIKLKLSFKYYVLEALTITLLENLRYRFPVKYIDADNIVPVITFNLLINQIVQNTSTKKIINNEEYKTIYLKTDYYSDFLKELKSIIGKEAEEYDNDNFKKAHDEITSSVILILEKYFNTDYHLDTYQSIKAAIDGLMTECKSLSNNAFYRKYISHSIDNDVSGFEIVVNGSTLKINFSIKNKYTDYFVNRKYFVSIFAAPEKLKDTGNDYFVYRKNLISDNVEPLIGNFVTPTNAPYNTHLFYKNIKTKMITNEPVLYFELKDIKLENLIKFKENIKNSLTENVYAEIGIVVPNYVTDCIVKQEDIWPDELKLRKGLIYKILKLPVNITDLLNL